MKKLCEPLRCVYCRFVIPQRIVMVVLCVIAIFVYCGQRSSFTVDSVTGFGNRTHNLLLYRTIDIEYYSVGCSIAQIPIGIIIDRFGAKWIFIEGFAIASILTCLTPSTNQLDSRILTVNKICLSIAQSVLFPSVAVILSQWVPYTQRGALGAFTLASYPIAGIVSQIVRDVLRYEWRTYLYLWGSIGLIWCGFNIFFLFDGPRLDPVILDAENEFLDEYIEPKKMDYLKNWRVFKDLSVWALILGQLAHSYSIFLMTFGLWHFFTVKFKAYTFYTIIVQTSGTLGLWFAATLTGRMIDYLIVTKGRNSKWMRRLTTYFSFVVSNLFLGLMCFVDEHIVCFCVFYCIAVVFKGLHYAGLGVNYMDITVNFCGTIVGVVNFCGDLCAYAINMIVGPYADDHNKLYWQVGITIVISLGSSTVYLLLADTKRADWD